MKPWLHKIEVIIDKSIPYLVLILLILIIGEFTHNKFIQDHDNLVLSIDYGIVIIFVIDLMFKYYRVKNAKTFVKKYWLDIIAVFPFFLIFRLVEELILFFRISSELAQSQQILHTTIEIGRISRDLSEEERILREIEQVTKLERTGLFARILRPLERVPRILEGFRFYEKPFKRKD